MRSTTAAAWGRSRRSRSNGVSEAVVGCEFAFDGIEDSPQRSILRFEGVTSGAE